APAYAAVICGEKVNCFFLQIPASIEYATIQQHLVEHRKIVGIGEKSGMPCNTAKQRRTLIVYITLHELPAEMLFFLRGHDLLGRKTLARSEAHREQTHPAIEILLHVFIQRHT